MHRDTVQILSKMRHYVEEGRLVRNPNHLFEDRHGNGALHVEDAERGCIIGLTSLVAMDLGLGSSAESDAIDAMMQHVPSGLLTMHLSMHGKDGTLDLINKALGLA